MPANDVVRRPEAASTHGAEEAQRGAKDLAKSARMCVALLAWLLLSRLLLLQHLGLLPLLDPCAVGLVHSSQRLTPQKVLENGSHSDDISKTFTVGAFRKQNPSAISCAI